MESGRFTMEDIENRRLPRIRRRRSERCCCSRCNSQIVCSYLIGLISSILVVSGVCLAIIQWNRIWLIISVSGFILTLFGSCLYYCGTQALVNSYAHSDEDDDDYEEEDCDNDDETHFPAHRRSRDQRRNGRKKRRKRGRTSAPDYVTRSLSQLSLNMIPQYFSPADTSFIRVPPGHLGTTTGSTLPCDPSTINGVGTITNSQNPVPVSQIFSVNGQSYLILPLNNESLPSPTQSSSLGTNCTGTNPSTALRRMEVGQHFESLPSIPRLPPREFCPQVITEKGNITEYLKENDPRYYKLIVSSNQRKEGPSTDGTSTPDGSISHGPLGTKINRKSLNRGRVAPGHHGSSRRIQETPLPPTPGSSQSSSIQSSSTALSSSIQSSSTALSSSIQPSSTAVPVSILDHNPLARIHSVTSGQSINPSPTPGLIPKRSASLRSSIRPLAEDRKQSSACINSGIVGEASTSNYFISFNPSHDGKVSSGSFPLTTLYPSSSGTSSVPSSFASSSGTSSVPSSFASSSGTSSDPSNPGMSVTGNSNHDTSNGASFAAAASSGSKFPSSSSSAATSSASSIQRGDTFSKRKKGSSLLRSMSEDSSQVSSSSHRQDQTGNSGINLTCNNGYLPLNEDCDESGQVITTTCTSAHSKDNQRIPPGSSAIHNDDDDDGNSIQSHQGSEEKRGKRIGTKLVDFSCQNVPPSSSGGASSSSSRVEKEGIRGRVNDTNHQRNRSSFSFDGRPDPPFSFDGRPDPQVIVNDSTSEADDECHAMYATCGYHNEDMIDNIYEETEGLILDVTDDNDQFSPPPSYAEVIQDSGGINFTPAINYDSRNFPTFINPISSSKQTLDHNSIAIVMDSKVSSHNSRQPSNNNPATESGAIHSTGTL